MKTQFTPIAMRFNKENWESIKDKIEAAGIGHNVWSTDRSYYLCNNWEDDNSLFIGNCSDKHSNIELVDKVYDTWDESIFLRACGIEVDTYTVSKEFILDGHKAACSTWKAKIEAQFPELFPKSEIGRWLKDDSNPKWLMYRDVKNIYGFDTFGNWFYRENESYEPNSFDRYATDKEVETALIAEANRRGFKEGVKIRHILYNMNFSKGLPVINNFNLTYDPNDNSLDYKAEDGQRFRLFKDGKWAEIISEPIELTLEQIAEKFNVSVEQLKIKK